MTFIWSSMVFCLLNDVPESHIFNLLVWMGSVACSSCMRIYYSYVTWEFVTFGVSENWKGFEALFGVLIT